MPLGGCDVIVLRAVAIYAPLRMIDLDLPTFAG
jgi:hypothetical protein